MAAAAASQSTRRRASPIGHAETVAMVRIMDAMDYDGDRGNYLHPNAHKVRIMKKVRSELSEKFSCERTANQLQKKWGDLKRKESDRLRQIREDILKQARRTKQRGRSRTSRRRSRPVSPPPPEPPQVSGNTTSPLEQPMTESAPVADAFYEELLMPLLPSEPQQATEEEEDEESDEAVPLDLSGSSPPATPLPSEPDHVQLALMECRNQIRVVQTNLVNSAQMLHDTFLSLKNLEAVIDNAMAKSLHFSCRGADADN